MYILYGHYVCVHTYVEFNTLLESQYLPDPESIRDDREIFTACSSL